MHMRNNTKLLLFLILGFISMLIGGFLLIFGAMLEINMMMYISIVFIVLAAITYSILFIMLIFYLARR